MTRAISRYLESQAAGPDLDALAGFPARLSLSWDKAQSLATGRTRTRRPRSTARSTSTSEQLQGKELSYNNVLDITSATHLIGEFERPTVAILKHTNPCGLASAESLADAWEMAYATDRQAPFGGIIIVNRTMDAALAAADLRDLHRGHHRAALRRRGARDSREEEEPAAHGGEGGHGRGRAPGDPLGRRRRAGPGPRPLRRRPLALQGGDQAPADAAGVGLDDLRLEGVQAREVERDRVLPGRAHARDRRGPDVAGRQLEDRRLEGGRGGPRPQGLCRRRARRFSRSRTASSRPRMPGATAAIQPGRSVRDAEVIKAADERGMAMVFTGIRHFRH